MLDYTFTLLTCDVNSTSFVGLEADAVGNRLYEFYAQLLKGS
jgi:hypothetical protein